MVYVGIDIAKFTHFAAVMDSDGVVHCKPFPFDNGLSGFKRKDCISRRKRNRLLDPHSIIHNLSFIIYHLSFIIYHLSFIILSFLLKLVLQRP